MGTFDADAYLEAKETPTLKIEGKVFTGKILSVDEYLPFAARYETLPKIDEDTTSVSEVTKYRKEYTALRFDFLRKTFPWKIQYLFGDPVKQAINSSLADVVFGNFFALAAMNLQPKAASKKMNGTNLQDDLSPKVETTKP